MIVLAFDPGVQTGVCVLETAGARQRILYLGSTENPLDALPAWLTPMAHGFSPDLVAIETIGKVKPKGSAGGIPARMATNLLETKELETKLAIAVAGYGVELVRYSASDWRRAITGRKSATNQQIAAALALKGLEGMPKRTNNHVRDALGLALYAAHKKRIDSMRRSA